jgi:hypothetical protein
MPSDTNATDLGHINPAIQRVEFKLTTFPREEGKVQALLRRERAQPCGARSTFTTPRTSRSTAKTSCCALG